MSQKYLIPVQNVLCLYINLEMLSSNREIHFSVEIQNVQRINTFSVVERFNHHPKCWTCLGRVCSMCAPGSGLPTSPGDMDTRYTPTTRKTETIMHAWPLIGPSMTILLASYWPK